MTRPRCSATTARGKPCRNAVVDESLCAVHLGRAHRPALLDADVADQLVAMLRAGNYMHVAARAVGITRKTLHEWIKRGASSSSVDEPYRELRERVEQARAEGEARLVTRIAKAAQDGRWEAAAWLLEREYPDRWGRVSTRLRDEAPPAAAPAAAEPRKARDVFGEIDELAARRARGA